MSVSELQLGDLEIAVLEEIWKSERGEARALHERLGTARGISLSTIQSTLERLYRKDLLSRERISHAYMYSPLQSREAVMARLIEGTLERFSKGRGEGLLAAFSGYAAQEADPEVLDRLEAVIRQHRKSAEGGAR